MKNFVLLGCLFLISCSTTSSFKFKKMIGAQIEISPDVGTTMDSILEKYGKPEQQFSYKIYDFISLRKNEILMFKDKKFVKKHTETADLSYNVVATSLSSEETSSSGVVLLLPGNKDTNPESLEYRYVQNLVAASLTLKGFKITEKINEASLLVFINSDISDPKVDIRTEIVPTYSYIPGTTTSVNHYSARSGYVGHSSISTPGSFYRSGSVVNTYSETSYNRYLMLSAIDNQYFAKTKKIREVWRTVLNSVGPLPDLKRLQVPLAFLSTFYLNKTTPQMDSFTMNDKDFHFIVFKYIVSNRLYVE